MIIDGTHSSHIFDPEKTGDDVLICRHGQKLHLHRTVLLKTWFRPVLHTRLEGERMDEEVFRSHTLALQVLAYFWMVKILSQMCLKPIHALCIFKIKRRE